MRRTILIGYTLLVLTLRQSKQLIFVSILGWKHTVSTHQRNTVLINEDLLNISNAYKKETKRDKYLGKVKQSIIYIRTRISCNDAN